MVKNVQYNKVTINILISSTNFKLSPVCHYVRSSQFLYHSQCTTSTKNLLENYLTPFLSLSISDSARHITHYGNAHSEKKVVLHAREIIRGLFRSFLASGDANFFSRVCTHQHGNRNYHLWPFFRRQLFPDEVACRTIGKDQSRHSHCARILCEYQHEASNLHTNEIRQPRKQIGPGKKVNKKINASLCAPFFLSSLFSSLPLSRPTMSAVVAAPTSGSHHVFAGELCSIDVLDLPRTLARRLKDHTLNCTFYVPHSSFCSFSAVSRGQFLELTEQSRGYFDVIQINKLKECRYVDIYR